MKTISKIIVAICLIFASAGVAQAKPIAFGIKAGLNVNSIKINKDFKDTFKSDNSCGWTAGVMADFTVPIIGIGCDVSLMYSRMNNGSDMIDISSPAGEAENLYGKNFLELPINLKYKLSLPVVGKYIAPYVFTGPNFAFRLDKSSTFQNLKSRTCQVAWNVGLGVQLVSHLQIGASYAFGINNIVDKVGLDNVVGIHTADMKVKNSYWTVTAAYLF